MNYLNIKKNLNIIKYDSISKFNVNNKNILFEIDYLKILVNLDCSNKNFIKYFYIVSKIFKDIFDRKLFIFKIKKALSVNDEKMNRGNKNNLEYYFGINIRKNGIYGTLDYLYNVIIPTSKKIDNKVLLKSTGYSYILKFYNLNYFLGWNNFNYFNILINFNYKIILRIKSNKFNKNNNVLNLKKKIYKFYEKIFYSDL